MLENCSLEQLNTSLKVSWSLLLPTPYPPRALKVDEVAMIALSAAATFSILDSFLPSMASSARSGAGFGIGANLVGFPR